jgi:hypothetical protein
VAVGFGWAAAVAAHLLTEVSASREPAVPERGREERT